MIDIYQVHTSSSAGESALLTENKLTKDQIDQALLAYAQEKSTVVGSYLGVSPDGALFTPAENWQPHTSSGFTDIFIVSWLQIHALLAIKRVGRAPVGRFPRKTKARYGRMSPTKVHQETTMQDKIEEIAKTVLGLETLQTRNSDGLDFHDMAVWAIKAALEAAYQAGQNKT